jgi:8-oxo-dGTP pyrophosphatase MutT (NUDIX family)
MQRVISAGAVIFRRETDGQVRFLLLYYGRNYWNFPKGKLEQGERAMAAFLREVEEETGLEQADLRILSGFRTTERFTFVDRYARHANRKAAQQPLVFKIVIYYLVETKKREVVISDEHDGFAWFTFHDALRVAKYKNTQSIIKRAHEFIQQHPPRTTTVSPKGVRRH